MISTRISELLAHDVGQLVLHGQTVHIVPENDDKAFDHVTTDSREVQESSIFVAIAGEHVDGHDFVADLPSSTLAVVDRAIEGAQCAQIIVQNTIKALGEIARLNISKRKALAARGLNEFTIIGITGSVGKTTTKDMLHAVLSRLAPTVAPQGSFNNDIGLPLTALKVNEKTRFFVAEMGATAVGEIEYLTTIAPPDISIVLKVGVAHLGGFGSAEAIRDAKSEIVRALSSSGVAVLNADDEYVRTMASMTKASSIIWFSRHSENEQPKPSVSGMVSSVILRGTDTIADSTNRPKFTVHLPDGTSFDLRLGMSGEHNVFNALAVLSVIYSLDIPEHIAASVLSQLATVSAHRMHIVPVNIDNKSFTLIDDSFNANPDSMHAGLTALSHYQADVPNTRRIAVLGSMLELGSSEDEKHRAIGAYAAQISDVVIAVGSQSDGTLMHLASCIAQGAQEEIDQTQHTAEVMVVNSPQEAQARVSQLAHEGHNTEKGNNTENTVVLLKGSHASGLSALADIWLEHACADANK